MTTVFHFNTISLHVFLPSLNWRWIDGKFRSCGVHFKTCFVICGRDWFVDWSVAFEILGFGLGVAKNYCPQPERHYFIIPRKEEWEQRWIALQKEEEKRSAA